MTIQMSSSQSQSPDTTIHVTCSTNELQLFAFVVIIVLVPFNCVVVLLFVTITGTDEIDNALSIAPCTVLDVDDELAVSVLVFVDTIADDDDCC